MVRAYSAPPWPKVKEIDVTRAKLGCRRQLLPEIWAASGELPADWVRASAATRLILSPSVASVGGSSGSGWSDFTAVSSGLTTCRIEYFGELGLPSALL